MISKKIYYVRLHWKSLALHTLFDALSWIFVIITIVGSLLAFLPFDGSEWLKEWIQILLLLVWPVALALSLILVIALVVNWPRTQTSFKDKNTDITVIIECCNIFKQKGLKVIHVVDTFDMELHRIITPHSLHGAFLQRCETLGVNVEEEIDKALSNLSPLGEEQMLSGRKNRYELGALCPIQVDNEPYCCVAFTHLLPNGNIEITKDEYVECLKRMWRNLSAPRIRNEEVNVAVMGNKFVDLPAEFSTEQKIDLMIQTFFVVAREKRICHTLRICIHPSNVTDVNFDNYSTIIEHLSKRPII